MTTPAGELSITCPKCGSLLDRSYWNQEYSQPCANTVVIRTRRVSEPDLQSLLRSKYNSLVDHPHWRRDYAS